MLKAKVAGDRLSIIAATKEDQEDLFRWVVAIGNGEFQAKDTTVGAVLVGTAHFLLADQWRIDLELMAPPLDLELVPDAEGMPFHSALAQILYSVRQRMGRFFDPSCGGCG